MLRGVVSLGHAEDGSLSGKRVPLSLLSAGREALAFARQAALLHRDVSATYPVCAGSGESVVVHLHGLFATAGVLRPMRRSIEREAGAHTASFTYAPGPGVASVARRLAELVERLPDGVRIHLVGHSMGGIVARWFVQELGGDPRVVQTISVASPFGGTRHARLLPGPAGRDISPGSHVLRRLEESAHSVPRVPHLSIASLNDLIVTESALFAVGERMVVDSQGHNGLLFDVSVAREIARRVTAHAIRAASEPAQLVA
jgi:triacylglycerol lipase